MEKPRPFGVESKLHHPAPVFPKDGGLEGNGEGFGFGKRDLEFGHPRVINGDVDLPLAIGVAEDPPGNP